MNYIFKQKSHSSIILPWGGQDRVNFHQNPGRGTAGGLTQPQPGQTEQGIPYHVSSCWVPGGGQRGGNSLAAREGSAVVQSERAVLFCGFVLCIPLFCIVVVTVPSVCCSALIPTHQFLPVFFPFFSARWRGEGQPCGAFVAGCSQNQNIC